jgi:hypothetical protein
VNATLAKILGLTQSVNSLERTNRKMSEAVSAFWCAQPVPPPEEEAAGRVCSAEDKGVPLRRQGEASAQKNSNPLCSAQKEEKAGQKKVSLVEAAYTVEPYIRTPEQIPEALFRESDMDSEPSPSRPKPRFKRIRASLLRDAADTSKPSYEEIFGWLAQEVQSRNPDGCKPVVSIMDGQESLWNGLHEYLPDVNLIEILGRLHVCLCVWKAAHLFYEKKSQAASRFAKQTLLRLLRGEVEGVIRGLRWKGTHKKLSKRRREELERICGYFENNHIEKVGHRYKLSAKEASF